jgi:hypothetical protein
MRRAVFMLCGCLVGCVPPPQSYVAPLSPEGAAVAAYDIVVFTEAHARPKAGPISVLQPVGDTVLWPVLTNDLRARGYTVTAAGRRQLRYSVSFLAEGTFLRVSLGSVSAARLYHQEPNAQLAPSGPFTVIEAAD